jgi:isopentenyl diphosphate isomerase/L-lactate dehydrogenase-like FMN-dependent dehydrogenase
MTDDALFSLGAVVKGAREKLNPKAWDYLIGGAEMETTIARNRQGLDSLAFRPRVLRDMRKVDLGRTFLGHKLRLPVLLAPIGGLTSLHPDGPLAVARAAEEFGTMSFLGSGGAVKEHPMEEVRAAGKAPMGYQLYVRSDDDWVYAQVQKCVDLGFQTFGITVDTAATAQRERELFHGYDRRTDMTRGDKGSGDRMRITWELIEGIKKRFDIPLVIKGIATAEDARLAVETGVDVIYVSNHGGRNLDCGMGTIDVLPEVAAAAKGRAKIIVDGGFFRGTDVIKGIARGADAVAIGKMQGWGIAAGGKDGVVRVLTLLESEIHASMINLGADSFDSLDSQYLRAAPPVYQPSVLSAFPQYFLPPQGA